MVVVFLLLFIIALLLLVLGVLYINTPKRLDIPGPPGLPIVGNYFTIMAHSDNRIGLFMEWFKKYGNVIHFSNFSRNAVFINDPACIQHVLQNNFKNYIRFPQNPTFEKLFGEGIFHSNGEAWKLHRETARPMFKAASIEKMAEVFDDRAQVVLQLLSQQPENESLDVQDLFMRYTLDSIGQIGFGFDIGSLRNPEKCEFANHFDSAQRIIERVGANPVIKYLPHPTFESNLKYLDRFVYEIIERRKKEGDFESKSDLLSRYMSLKNENGQPLLTDSYLRDAVLNFFIAGRDTTGILLTWTFYLLSLHPEEKLKLLEEIKQTEHLAEPSHRFNSKRLKEMKRLHNVLRETLRLYPPVPIDGRTALEDDVLPTGHVIKGGTGVAYCAFALHRTEKFWGSDAEKFRPERWEGIGEGGIVESQQEGVYHHPFQFVPFHAGPQTCLGQNMAYREAKILVCLVLSRFEFRLDESHQVRPRKSLVLPADQGVKLFFQEREKGVKV